MKPKTGTKGFCKRCHRNVVDLKKHTNSHKVVCAYCTKAITIVNFARHSKTNHKNLPQKKLSTKKCPHCGKNYDFSDQKFFRSHVQICFENPESDYAKKAFNCYFCHDSFANKHNLRLHISRHHPEQGEQAIEEGESATDQEIEAFESENFDVSSLFVEKQRSNRISKRFKANEKCVRFTVSELGLRYCRAGLILIVIYKILDNIISLSNYHPDSLISVTIDSPALNHGHVSHLAPVKNFNLDTFLIDFEKIIDSSDVIELQNDELSIEIRNIDLRTGVSGGRRLKLGHFHCVRTFLNQKNGLADPAHMDNSILYPNSCFALSIAMSLHAGDKSVKRKRYFRAVRKFPKAIEEIVVKIYEAAGIEFDTEISANNYQAIDNYIRTNYSRNLVVYCVTNEAPFEYRLVYHNRHQRPNPVSVLTADGHAWLICSVRLLFGAKGYCIHCMAPIPVGGRQYHSCFKKCCKCYSSLCATYLRRKSTIASFYCENCRCFFRDSFCLEQHLLTEICAKYKRCVTCCRRVKTDELYPPESHHCGQRKCFNCDQWQNVNHNCFLRAPSDRACENRDKRLLFFDIECRTIDTYLKPFVFCLLITCRECEYDTECDPYEYKACCKARRLKTWFGDECVRDACKYIFFNNNLKSSILIGHNASGFDGFYIVEALVSLGNTPKLLIRSNRILKLTAGKNVSCICSLQFFHCKLEALPKIFNLTATKQFLPLGLLKNLDLKRNIKGYVPQKSVWEPQKMNPKRKAEFEVFYANLCKTPETFDLFLLICRYCGFDVIVLYQSCMAFRRLVFGQTSVCPFTSGCCTLTSLTAKIWRKKFLYYNLDTRLTGIPLIPDVDSVQKHKDNQSYLAKQYLAYLQSRDRNIKIVGANVGREHRIGSRRVDALVTDQDDNPLKIVEVNGCFFHAHESSECTLFPHITETHYHPLFKPLRWIDVCARSTFRQKELEQGTGVEVEVIWECEIKKLLRSNISMDSFFLQYDKDHHFRKPIDPRDSLYGGRVSQGILLAQLSESLINDSGYRMSHFDLNSLYPHSMVSNVYPIDHPSKIEGCALEDFELTTLEKYFGLIKVRTLPPADQIVIFPPLPLRVHDKLMFPLCKTCAEEQKHNSYCNHSMEERSWVATYTTPEYFEAVKHWGYRTLEVFHIWTFEKKSDCVFKRFVNHWAQLKFKASGFPHDVKTHEQKSDYVNLINSTYNSNMTIDQITDNPGLRKISKDILNSLWGRLGLSSAKGCREAKIISTESELRRILAIPGVQIGDARIVSAERLLLIYDNDINLIGPSDSMSNVILATFTLAYARLILNRMLSKIDWNACYTDTDSIIFIHHKDSDLVPEETYIFGGWKSEIPENHTIKDFVCLGPKVYAYNTAEIDPETGKLVENGETTTTMKAKGLRVDCRASIGFEEMKTVLVDNLESLGRAAPSTTQKRQHQQLSVPDPTIARNLLKDRRGVMKVYEDRVKKLNFSLAKRQYLYMPNDMLGVVDRTQAWGTRFDCPY